MRLRITLFILVALGQLALPVGMIARHEYVLSEGRAFRFATAPVDPVDLFRGRYVALRFRSDAATVPPGLKLERGQEVCVGVVQEEDGLARLSGVSLAPPPGRDWLKVRVKYVSGGKGSVSFELPFERYYMNETLAPQAEAAYRRAAREREPSAYALVRVRDGVGVLEELYLDNLPVREYLAREAGE